MPRDSQLHLLCYKGQKNDVLEMLQEGEVDVNAKGAQERSSLHRAVGAGHTDIVEILIQYKANVNQKDKSGRTPLHWSALCGNVELFKILMKANADISLVTKAKQNCLHIACDNGKADMVAFLIEENVLDISAQDGTGRTAIEIAEAAKAEDICRIIDPSRGQGCCIIQ